jgi:CheY-like chemotaxis protein
MVYNDMNDGSVLNVLIVEDSIFFADITIRTLKRNGLNVNCKVVSTRAALQAKLREEKWDVILSDNVMPGFNALGALAVRNELCADTPFIIVSEDISEKELKTAFTEGCNSYLAKEKITELPELIKKLVIQKQF